MKYCPTCRSQYTDETLRFCLQDGAVLVDKLAADTPTVPFAETPTVERSAADSQVTSWRNEQVTRETAVRPGENRHSFLYIFAAVAGVLLLVVIGSAVGIWFYVKKGQTPANVTANSTNNSTYSNNGGGEIPSPSRQTTRPLPSVSPTPVTLPSTSTDVFDKARAVREVSGTISNWKALAEARDLNNYMENYADVVDYYRRSSVSRSIVRSDKARAFGMFNSIRISITNLSVNVDEFGTRAVADFDKEWDFRGSRSSSGKVHSQLRFRLENGRWLITSEKDLKVYYVN
jgi:hypothetical protein